MYIICIFVCKYINTHVKRGIQHWYIHFNMSSYKIMFHGIKCILYMPSGILCLFACFIYKPSPNVTNIQTGMLLGLLASAWFFFLNTGYWSPF